MEPQGASNRSFADFAHEVKTTVDAALDEWLKAPVLEAESLHSDVGQVAGAVRSLALRGGKRLRPVLCVAAYEAFGGEGGARAVAPALVSLELLQAYLLIHDDWMDGDDVRRGGPSAHAALSGRFGSTAAGAVGAVLAGDLGAAYALEALMRTNVPPAALLEATREFAEMQRRVVLGQTLDVRGVASGAAEVERMHDFKTASYTVRGPARLGAALAGADSNARMRLDSFASAAGIAFQLRDDLLGLFGDPAVTGKPRGNDLREKKRTAVVADLWLDARWRARLEHADRLEQSELEALVSAIEKEGARARVEARIAALTETALARVAELPISLRGRALLDDVVHVLTRRQL